MHRMGVYLGLVEGDDFSGEYAGDYGGGYADGEYDYAPERAAERPPVRRDGGYADARYSSRGGYDGDYAEVEQYANNHGRASYQITALHPRTYNEARTIGEAFRNNTPVIMNLSDMDDADAKRLVDFAAGLIFGLHGSIDRVTTKVFLLTPRNVTVTAEDKARMVENGFFNQS
jgi:cell division inhibitor SepF